MLQDFITSLHNLLIPQTKRALEYLKNGVQIIPSGVGRTPEEALAEHLIISCAYGKESIFKEDNLLREYTKIPNNRSATYAVQFISNQAKDQFLFKENVIPERKSFWPQAKEFWRIRSEVVMKKLKKRKRTNEEDEFDREFSRYLSWLPYLPDKITLKDVESLLKDSIHINKRGWYIPDFIDYLKTESDKYAAEAIGLLVELQKTNAPSHFYHGKNKEIEVILKNAIIKDKDAKNNSRTDNKSIWYLGQL